MSILFGFDIVCKGFAVIIKGEEQALDQALLHEPVIFSIQLLDLVGLSKRFPIQERDIAIKASPSLHQQSFKKHFWLSGSANFPLPVLLFAPRFSRFPAC